MYENLQIDIQKVYNDHIPSLSFSYDHLDDHQVVIPTVE